MIVFSEEFGSSDPFLEAVQAARWMAENDAWGFLPHIGLSSGRVIVGYVGTPLKYNCSVFGAPVALAARCAAVPLDIHAPKPWSSSITFPAAQWEGRNLSEAFPPVRDKMPDGTVQEHHMAWELLPEREVDMKNMPPVNIREIVRRAVWFPTPTAEERAREGLAAIKGAGRYWRR